MEEFSIVCVDSRIENQDFSSYQSNLETELESTEKSVKVFQTLAIQTLKFISIPQAHETPKKPNTG
jgi:hypothetical protein